MTSAASLREGDKVAVSRNGDWKVFRLGVVQRVMNNGATVRFDDAATRRELKGTDVICSCIRFAYKDGDSWVAERERRQGEQGGGKRQGPSEPPARDAGAAPAPAEEVAASRAHDPSAAHRLLVLLRSAGASLDDVEAALKEARAAEAAEQRRAAVERAEAELEEARVAARAAASRREKADAELEAARELVSSCEAEASRAGEELGAAVDRLRRCEAELASARAAEGGAS